MKNQKLIPWKEIREEIFDKEELIDLDEKAKHRIAVRNIKELRENMGLTQIDISEISGITRSTISKIETGSRNVSIKKLMQIASAMDMDLEIRLVPRK